VVYVGHLKHVDNTLSSWHVDALAVGVEVQVVHVLHAANDVTMRPELVSNTGSRGGAYIPKNNRSSV
jgi:hypothetical protein